MRKFLCISWARFLKRFFWKVHITMWNPSKAQLLVEGTFYILRSIVFAPPPSQAVIEILLVCVSCLTFFTSFNMMHVEFYVHDCCRDRLQIFSGGRTKPPILNETKQPILKTRQNSQFWKRDNIADFGNGRKRPISKKRQNRRFWSGTKQPISKKRQNRRFFFCLYLNSN